jgi:hypothetical protein
LESAPSMSNTSSVLLSETMKNGTDVEGEGEDIRANDVEGENVGAENGENELVVVMDVGLTLSNIN